MKKVLQFIAVVLIQILLTGCTSTYKAEFLLKDGSYAEEHSNGNLSMTLEINQIEATLIVKNMTAGTITIRWPKDSFTLPDGSTYTLAYTEVLSYYELPEKNLGDEFKLESDDIIADARMYYFKTTDPITEKFVDYSPRKIVENGQLTFRVVLVRDPDDFTSPLKRSSDDESFSHIRKKLEGFKLGELFRWRFQYTVPGNDIPIDDEAKFRFIQ